jgi:hypothetical protein
VTRTTVVSSRRIFKNITSRENPSVRTEIYSEPEEFQMDGYYRSDTMSEENY